MEGKVFLYDENNIKIGETFMRRAKQLVKQQRASWLDEKQDAVRFAPGMENLDADDTDAYEKPSAVTTSSCIQDETGHDESSLILLAERRIYERKFFKFHSIAFIPGLFITFIFTVGIADNVFTGDGAILFFGFSWGSWVTAYGLHAYSYFKNRRLIGPTKDRRKERELAVEVALLKTELGR